ncbi:hypothetical protein D046_7917 [Vibrio parahaemolyticus V-223/04]|nr:hypothetical protein D046_7917 [Vibrio parahaemolyticus V-223/04]
MRCSHLNRALVAKEKNAAKAECLGLMFVHSGSVLYFKF